MSRATVHALALLGLVSLPLGAPLANLASHGLVRAGIALAALVTLALRPGGDAPAGPIARGAVLVAALLAPLGWFLRPGVPPSLLLFPAFVLEALTGAGTDRDARRRASGFCLVGALSLVHGAEQDSLGPVSEDVLFVLSTIAAGATLERCSGPARRLASALLLAATLAWALCHLPFEAARARGLAAGVVFVGTLSCVVFFLAAKTLARGPSPGPAAATVATLLASLVAAEAGLRLKETLAGRSDTLDAVRTFAAPLVAFGGPDLLLGTPEGRATRRDGRGHVFTTGKPRGKFRIALLGGSSAWGLFQKDRASSPAGRIEAHLAAQRPGLDPEVLCLAYPALASDQELGWVLGHALDWQLDLVLALDDYNDLSYLARRAAEPGAMFGWEQHHFGFSRPFERFLLKYSVLLRPFAAARAIQPAPGRRTDFLPGAANGFWLDALVANEETLAILARDAGARFVWASVPITLDRTVLGPGEELDDAPNGTPMLRKGVYAEEVKRRNRELRARVTAAVTARGGVAVDLPGRIARRSAGAPNETWFGDECHYTDRGADVVAEEVVRAMIEAGILEP